MIRFIIAVVAVAAAAATAAYMLPQGRLENLLMYTVALCMLVLIVIVPLRILQRIAPTEPDEHETDRARRS